MCIICISIEKNKITINEARQHLREMRPMIPEDHARELDKKFGTSSAPLDEQLSFDLKHDTDLAWLFDPDDYF